MGRHSTIRLRNVRRAGRSGAVRWGLGTLLALGVAALAFAVVLFAHGRYDRIPIGAAPSVEPLAAVCLSHPPRDDRRLLARCFRISGTLLYVRRGYDDHARLDEIHLLVAAHFHLVVVKLVPPFPRTLTVGSQVTAVGPLLETHPSRLGIHEVQAFSFSRTG